MHYIEWPARSVGDAARLNARDGKPRGVVIATLLLFLWFASLISLRGAAGSGEFARLMNAGKAQLENRNSEKAIEAFAAALKIEPKSPHALRNLARALMLANQNEAALKPLDRARSLDKGSVATSYLTGLACVHLSQFERAIPFLEEAVRLDAFTPSLRFQLANAYQLARQQEKAVTQLRETIRLDPLHASARFKLGAHAAQVGDRAEFERQQQEFQRLRKLFGDDSRSPTALERCLYTQPEPPPTPTPAIKPGASINMSFIDATKEMLPDEAARAVTAAAVLETDETGGCTVVTVDAQGGASLLKMEANGRFKRTPVTPAPFGHTPIRQCLAGNFYDDVPKGEKYDPTLHARNDLLLVGAEGIRLLKRTGPAAFEDVTDQAGLGGVTARRVQWIDYDHDGDLDLLVAVETGLQLWQNNGDARFTNVTAQAGFSGVIGAVDAMAVDLDGNVAIDALVARGAEPTLAFINQRAGRFARSPEPPGPWPPARRVLADDLDNDGYVDVVLVGEKGGLVLFGERATRKEFEWPAMLDSAVALFDFDNDGWLDFCVAGTRPGSPNQGTIRLWRNAGPAWTDATASTGLGAITLPVPRDLIAADFDADGDTDLLVISAAGPLHFLRNEGGNANAQLKLRLVGTKTNPTGLGTRVEVRAGNFRAARSVSALPVEIGLGRLKQLDSVQTIWGNGVVDNQIEVKIQPPPLTITEKNVATGSCPYLYGWDGRGFRFITDLLGNSPLGLSLSRETVLPANPEEFVVIGSGATFRPRRGSYEVEVTEELREVLYLDCARLIAVDHPPDTEVHSTDKLGPPPFPPSELWLLHSPKAPQNAQGSDGIDRTEAVRTIDGVFAPPGLPLPPPLRGQCQPLSLMLDFGPLESERPLVLALTGWIQYGDASANIAASQNARLSIIPPKLEIETTEGLWMPVEVVVGMPAGKSKTILCDLSGKLPRGGRRLRLTTTFELHWDRIALFERGGAAEMQRWEMLPNRATLRWRGFSEIKSRGPGHPKTPAYAVVSERPPWRTTLQGWCTRYGDVRELVKSRDDRLTLLNAGDALNLRFDPQALPSLARGRQRTFFFYSVGWDKDGDHNVVDGDTVEPLPVSASGHWTLDYNTRWVSGWMMPARSRIR